MICVDSSVAVKWLLDEILSEQADALLTDVVDSNQRIVAPALLPIEVTNVIWQHIRGGLRLDEGEQLVERFAAYPIDIRMTALLQQDVLRVAAAYNLSAAYDAQYIALAQQLGATFWTADERLLNALGGKLPRARWIGDYPL